MRIAILTVLSLILLSADVAPQVRPQPIGRLLSASSALNADGPAAPESIVAIRGMVFTDESAWSCCVPAYELAGVRVWIGDEPQPIVAAGPAEIRIVPRIASSWIVVRAKDGRMGYAPVRMAKASPGITILGEPDSEEFRAKRPLAFYFDDRQQPQPVGMEPIPMPGPGRWRILTIFGAGWRRADSRTVRVAGVECPVLAWSEFAGLLGQDQITIGIPGDLPNRGEVEIVIEADGRVSNSARVRIE